VHALEALFHLAASIGLAVLLAAAMGEAVNAPSERRQHLALAGVFLTPGVLLLAAVEAVRQSYQTVEAWCQPGRYLRKNLPRRG
jgi:hypothetical protein